MNNERLEDFIGKETINMVEALKKIDKNARGVLFIVDENEKLVGALSDGDIRRWLIKTGDLNSQVHMVMNKKPKYLKMDKIEKAKARLKKFFITAIPIVDDEMRIVDIIDDKGMEENEYRDKLKDVPVVMMAGGKGTRLYPYTQILPKPLIPVGEKPIAEHIIDSFCKYGCNEFHLIVNHKKNMIKAYFNEINKEYNVFYADEDKPLGTGGGISLLKGKIDKTFILTNCDILIEEDYSKMYAYHKEHGNLITMICSLKNFSIPYGVINLAENGTIGSMEEKPTFSFFTNTGCYIVEPEVIEDMPEDTVIGFPDIIEKYRKEGKNVGVYPIGENAWMDMGQVEELEKMRERLERK